MGEVSYSQISRDILKTLEPPGKAYYRLLAVVIAVLAWGITAWTYQIYTGLGVAGITQPVLWGVYVATFVFWIGIAHSGTLISAILFLFRARWRTPIYRSAEAMTVFAVITAALFPIIHLGRPWFFYWVLPYPNQRGLWVNFRSPLIWDVFAILTYLIVSMIFLFTGLIPDVAAARDRATGWRKRFYGLLALGWQGTDRQWRHFTSAYLFFAALATPLVVSVHSVVSWDFAVAIVPGWHSTIFAPYFVAGAIFSGVAMVLTLLIPLRRIFRLEAYITEWHFENLAKILILTSLIVTYAYGVEFFLAWYSGNPFEQHPFYNRAFGYYAPLFWLMLFCNSIIPLALFFPKVRRQTTPLFVISFFINIGMWLERFIIVVSSLSHEYIPFEWGIYWPTWVEVSIIAGSLAWFFLWFLLFVKHLPAVSITEVKEGATADPLVGEHP